MIDRILTLSFEFVELGLIFDDLLSVELGRFVVGFERLLEALSLRLVVGRVAVPGLDTPAGSAAYGEREDSDDDDGFKFCEH